MHYFIHKSRDLVVPFYGTREAMSSATLHLLSNVYPIFVFQAYSASCLLAATRAGHTQSSHAVTEIDSETERTQRLKSFPYTKEHHASCTQTIPVTFPFFLSPNHTFSAFPQRAKIIILVKEVLLEALLL